ncbi:hypothetical protein QUB70_21955 [Microcoleus sp. A003_D6]|uniref:hypothetical protein n=1 Tax=Microcoleus sp. A003_D6 TaxID=3055266 RepID=UPI002FD6ACB4
MFYNKEMLPTFSLHISPRNIKNLLDKLLSLRRIEYLAVDRELKIQETSLNLQEFADIPNGVEKEKYVRDSFPEPIGIEEVLDDILEERQPTFQLKSVTRVLNDGSYLYLNLYIFGQKEQLKPEREINYFMRRRNRHCFSSAKSASGSERKQY